MSQVSARQAAVERERSSRAQGTFPPALRLNSLLAGCARRDQSALAEIYSLTAARFFGLALRIVRSRDRAEEVLQDAYLRIFLNASKFDPGRGSAFGWMATIVRHRAIDMVRGGQAGTVPLDEDMAETLPAADSDDILARLEAVSAGRALRDCIGKLTAEQRRAILSAYYNGLTYNEVAGMLGAPLGTVKSWVRRGLMSLKSCLEN